MALSEENKKQLEEIKQKLSRIPEEAKEAFPVLFASFEQLLLELEDEDSVSEHTIKDLKDSMQDLYDRL